jgi:hypothetical protein
MASRQTAALRSWNVVEYCTRVARCRAVSCRVVSCRVVSCRVVSCRVVSCRVGASLGDGLSSHSINRIRHGLAWLEASGKYRYCTRCVLIQPHHCGRPFKLFCSAPTPLSYSRSSMMRRCEAPSKTMWSRSTKDQKDQTNVDPCCIYHRLATRQERRGAVARLFTPLTPHSLHQPSRSQ